MTNRVAESAAGQPGFDYTGTGFMRLMWPPSPGPLPAAVDNRNYIIDRPLFSMHLHCGGAARGAVSATGFRGSGIR